MMKKSFIKASMFVVVLFGAQVATADVRVCTAKEAQEAEEVASNIESWEQLNQIFERYNHCDDGAIGEGFSESVSLLLVKQWESIAKLGKIVASRPQFLHFVIRHIDGTLPSDRLGEIIKNANLRCPPDMQALCHNIKSAASMSVEGQ